MTQIIYQNGDMYSTDSSGDNLYYELLDRLTTRPGLVHVLAWENVQHMPEVLVVHNRVSAAKVAAGQSGSMVQIHVCDSASEALQFIVAYMGHNKLDTLDHLLFDQADILARKASFFALAGGLRFMAEKFQNQAPGTDLWLVASHAKRILSVMEKRWPDESVEAEVEYIKHLT
jgi:hypothetical protein